MDPRPPQHPFSRPQDRPLIHNPNHQPTPPQPQHPAFPSYAPSVSQAPVHIPFADPFQRRGDPFMPNTQHQRRASYTIPGRDAMGGTQADRPPAPGGWAPPAGLPTSHGLHQHHQQPSGPPPPPQMTAPNNPPASMSYPYDSARRRSLGGGSPPQYYGAQDGPPPPPSFGARSMPPPSSPQQRNPPPPYSGVRPPPPPPFSNGRDLPALGGIHQPGSSMSISSLIGGEGSTAQHAAQQSLPTAAKPPSPGMRAMRPPSPRRRPSLGSGPDFGPYRRDETPEMHGSSSVAKANDLSAYASSSPRLFAGARGSPEQARNSFPHATHNYGTVPALGARPYQSSPSDTDSRNSENRLGPTVPPRPNSQPAALFAPPPELGPRDRAGVPAFRHPFLGPSAEDRRRMLEEAHQQKTGGSDPTDRVSQPPAEGDRAATAQPASQPAFGPQELRHSAPQTGPSQPPRTFLGWPQAQDARTREAGKPGNEQSPSLFRLGFASQVTGNQGQGLSPGTTLDQLRQRVSGQYPGVARDVERRTEPPPASTPLGSNNGIQPRAPSFDHPIRRPGEDMQPQRSLLGVSPEASRRAGRASPLPQAVQGAQAQLVGPSGDPNIKSEFGRMFGGLGGLGSAPAGNGTSTPSRQSPMPQNGAESLPPSNDAEGARIGRTASQTGRRGRRVKDEDAMGGSESGDGRGTPGLGRVGSKRAKHTHPAHHHHHHPHSHHHHHHHHKPDDDLAVVGANQPNNNPFTTLRFNNNTPQNVGGPTAHHHHHHHHPPHHHHHPPKATQPPKPSSPVPTKTVNSQAVLDSVASLPREHLGSMLYTATLGVPPLATYRLDSKFQYESHHKPIPNFAGKENCTFTVRVPRYYLLPDQREEICLRRNVWGTDIYTDDSDPIAAAIHGGWIRGEWGEDVDPEYLLELAALNNTATSNNNANKDQPIEIPETMTSPLPSGPVLPPQETDLHITLLILPKLAKYTATTRFGLRSRAWGTTDAEHSGLSFKILKLEWVDEGSASRGEERGADARRRRLQAALSLVEMFGGGREAQRERAGRGNGTGGFGRVAQAVA